MRKKYTSKYKAQAVLEILREAESLSEIAGRLEVHPTMLGRWKKDVIQNLHTVFEDKGSLYGSVIMSTTLHK